MKKILLALILLANSALLAGAALPAESTAAPAGAPSFQSFHLVLDRNIFDPNRQPARLASAPRPVATPAPVTEHLDLLGILVAGTQPMAFVEGGSHSPLALGDLVGAWRVALIDTSRVQLSRADKHLDWPVGQRIERPADQEDWRLTQSPVLAQAAAPPSSSLDDYFSGATGSSTAAPAATPAPSFSRDSSGSGSSRNDTSRGGRHSHGGGSRGGYSSGNSVSAAPSPTLAPAAPVPAPAPAAAAAGGSDSDSMIQQMMARRHQEGGQ